MSKPNLPPKTRVPDPHDLASLIEGWRVREGITGKSVGQFKPDQVVTRRDLVDLGIASFSRSGSIVARGPGTGAGSTSPMGPVDTGVNDPRPPSKLTGLHAEGLATAILLTVDPPSEVRVAYIEWWRAAVDDQSQAVKTGESVPPIYPDPVGAGKAYYYWVRAVSKMGVPGPFNQLAGTKASTGVDPAYVLSQLNDQLSQNDSAVVVRTDNFAIMPPGGGTEVAPFVTGNIDGTFTVGIDGNLVVDGTLNINRVIAGKVNADKVNVSELSAFTANMGTLTSGTVRTGAAPAVRAELSSVGSFPFWIGAQSKSANNALLYVDTLGNLVARGITIYGDSGEVLLSSGTGVVAPDSFPWGSITGKPGFTPFATLDQINPSNVTTFVANAAIDTAQIRQAAVDTLRIRGHAVTIPTSITLNSHTTYGDAGQSTPSYSAGSASWTSDGNVPVFFIGYINITLSIPYDGVTQGAMWVRVKLNGSTIEPSSYTAHLRHDHTASATKGMFLLGTRSAAGTLSGVMTMEVATTRAGTNTIAVEASYAGEETSGGLSALTITGGVFALETKR